MSKLINRTNRIQKILLNLSINYKSCGRIPCFCINNFNFKNINDYKKYKKCYRSWINFYEKTINTRELIKKN